jgi:hypothetical protein
MGWVNFIQNYFPKKAYLESDGLFVQTIRQVKYSKMVFF